MRIEKSSQLQKMVRDQDYDRYVASLFVPAKHRCAIWALLAFNHEVAKTAEVVSEPMLGEIRLQWWHDAIDEIYEGKTIRQHDIVTPLAEVIVQYDLPRDLFDQMIDARLVDLEEKPFQTVAELLTYTEKTSANLLHLVAQVLDVEEEGLEALGQAYALAGIIRAMPYQLQQNRMMAPQEMQQGLLDQQEKKKQGVLEAVKPENIKKLVEEIFIISCDHLEIKENYKLKYFRVLHKVTQNYLAQIKQKDFDIYQLHSLKTPSVMRLVFA